MRRSSFARNISVYGIFTISGASALIYQVLWSRWLTLSFGSTTASVSVVLGCFMTGLALGSFGAGRFLHRVGNPMGIYAAMELGIGVFALIFPFLFRLVDSVFPLLVHPDSPAFYSLSVRALFSFLLLSVPTTLMGTTLPLLTEFFRRNPRHSDSFKVGILYAANTLGAALGILAASFVLIEWVGVFATTMIAASLNFLVAALGSLLSRQETALAVPEPTAVPPQAVSKPKSARAAGKELPFPGKLATAVLMGSGAAALASEVLWTRTLETLVGNSTYAFATIVLIYLVGISLGSWLMAMVVHRLRRRYSLWLASLLLAMGGWGLASVVLFERLAEGIAIVNGPMVHLSVLFLAYLKAMLILIPLSILSGACFPLAARMIEPDSEDPKGESIAGAYSWNTAGAVAGSLLAGFLVAPNFEFFDALYLLALSYGLIALATLVAVAWREREEPSDRAILVPTGAAVLAVIGLSVYGATGESSFVQHLRKAPGIFDVPFHKPGLQGVVTVVKQRARNKLYGDDRYDMLLVNGMGMTVKVTDTKMMAHLPLLLHPDPENVLVICFGMGTTYRSAVSHGGNVEVVELVQEVFDAFPHFYSDAARIRAYPKGRMIVNDGRNFLKLTRETFDVITIDPPPPIDAAGVVHLYSKEFIELAKSRLEKGGIMTHWYPYPGTGSGIDDWTTFKSLVDTFVEAFPYVYMKRGYSGMGVHLLGTMEPLARKWSEVEKRYYSPSVANDILEWDAVPLSFFGGLSLLKKTGPDQPPLTDDNPYLEFYLLRTLREDGKKMFPVSFW